MDSKVQELLTPLSYRLAHLQEHQGTLPVLVALGAVLLSYLIYNVSLVQFSLGKCLTYLSLAAY